MSQIKTVNTEAQLLRKLKWETISTGYTMEDHCSLNNSRFDAAVVCQPYLSAYIILNDYLV